MVRVSHPRSKGIWGKNIQSTQVTRLVITVIIIWTLRRILFSSDVDDDTAVQDSAQSSILFDSNTSLMEIKLTGSASYEINFPSLTEQQGKQHIMQLFKESGRVLTPEMEAELPTWSQVQEVVGPHPYIVGWERCEAYRRKVPPLERMLGAAGMFNSGTNLVTHLLKQNCEIPERREVMGPHQPTESYGMRWQVPWGKHTPAKFRDLHATQKAGKMKINKDFILPIVTLRNPYTWFRSTCKNSYTARWKRRRGDPTDCPALKDPRTGEWNNVSVHYGAGDDSHQSLAHLWNEWYSYYIKEANFPWIAIRMEDLVFYPKETIHAVCECAGGKIRTDRDFVFISGSAKADSRGHDTSTGMYEAWIKYSKHAPPKFGFSDIDYDAAKEALDADLMAQFGYQHPPPF